MAKLRRNAKIDGVRCLSASQKSRVELMPEDGILMSMINSVNAMANTPSENASRRALMFVSATGEFAVAGEFTLQRRYVDAVFLRDGDDGGKL